MPPPVSSASGRSRLYVMERPNCAPEPSAAGIMSPNHAVLTTTSRKPPAASLSRWYSMRRLPPTLSRGLGSASVSGRMRSPRPAARTMTFTKPSLVFAPRDAPACAAHRAAFQATFTGGGFARQPSGFAHGLAIDLAGGFSPGFHQLSRCGAPNYPTGHLLRPPSRLILRSRCRLALLAQHLLRFLPRGRLAAHPGSLRVGDRLPDRGVLLLRVCRRQQRRDAPLQPAAELHQLLVEPAGVQHVIHDQRQIVQVADLAVAMPEPCEDAQHLDVPLHADEVEPAQELVLAVADVRAESAEHTAVALDPAFHALARPADVAVLEQRHEVVADGAA